MLYFPKGFSLLFTSFYFWLDPKVTKNQVGANAFLDYWVDGTTQQPKTRIGQTVLQHDIVCFFIEFSSLVLFPKGRFYMLVPPTNG